MTLRTPGTLRIESGDHVDDVMATPPWTEGCLMPYLSAADRRDQIIDAAVAVIAEEGLAKATTRRIAERAGAPLGALHYCFRGKEELLEAVLDRVRTTMQQAFADVDPEKGFDATVRTAVDSYWHWIRDNPGLHLAIVELVMRIVRREKPGKRLHASVNDPHGGELLRTSLAHAAEVDGMALAVPADELARFIVHRFDGLIFEYAESADKVACERQADLLAEAIVALASPAPRRS